MNIPSSFVQVPRITYSRHLVARLVWLLLAIAVLGLTGLASRELSLQPERSLTAVPMLIAPLLATPANVVLHRQL